MLSAQLREEHVAQGIRSLLLAFFGNRRRWLLRRHRDIEGLHGAAHRAFIDLGDARFAVTHTVGGIPDLAEPNALELALVILALTTSAGLSIPVFVFASTNDAALIATSLFSRSSIAVWSAV